MYHQKTETRYLVTGTIHNPDLRVFGESLVHSSYRLYLTHGTDAAESHDYADAVNRAREPYMPLTFPEALAESERCRRFWLERGMQYRPALIPL